MNRKVLCVGLLAASISCAFSSDRSSVNLVPPPPVISVRVSDVAVRGVCLVKGETYYLYTQPRAAGGYTALTTRVANGATVDTDAAVRSENCANTAASWPEAAVGQVQAVVTASGAMQPELVVGGGASGCTLHLDLKAPGRDGGGTCAPVNTGFWGYCGCPELYPDKLILR